MKLYKNVDICDLGSILKKGVLSLNKSQKNNWEDGKRANNSCDVVYLFDPLGKENSFTQYGAALLEIEVENPTRNKMFDYDINLGKYDEYIVDEVTPDQIKAIYIPLIFRDKIDLPEELESKITWCGLRANYYGDDDKENCPDYVLERFAQTAAIVSTESFNFFRGVNEDRTMIDLYDIEYLF